MKIAVEPHCELFMIACTIVPIQLSPRSIDVWLCCESWNVGVTIASRGRRPILAWLMMVSQGRNFWTCELYRHSAKLGQVLHAYPVPTLVFSVPSPESRRHDNPAASIRSMIVGTYCTGDGRYGPLPFWSGMHEGT